MPSPAPSRDQPTHAGARFNSTLWSVVLALRRGSADRPKALQRLCVAYWLPIYSYIRRRDQSPADAEDLTQGFFASLLENDFLERSDPAKGRFRGYLVAELRHFLADHFERAGAQKRGAGQTLIDWNLLDAESEYTALAQPQLDPSEAYEKTWALTLLGRAMDQLKADQDAAGKSRVFSMLQPFLSTTPTPGDYDAAARALGTSRTNVAVWVHRLNHRYAEFVKLEVATTVRSPDDVAAEMQHLLLALRR